MLGDDSDSTQLRSTKIEKRKKNRNIVLRLQKYEHQTLVLCSGSSIITSICIFPCCLQYSFVGSNEVGCY